VSAAAKSLAPSVQKERRCRSGGRTMVIIEHSAETLASLHWAKRLGDKVGLQ
jgi:hypothetical protein